jgi:DNA gyrase subunit B
MEPTEIAESIRKRPGMYIGPTDDRGLRQMIWEVVANSIDEHLAGHCSRIVVEIGADGSISVEDNGRGISLAETDGVSLAERALTSMHQTPTLDGHAPHEHIGGLGLGLFPVCVLSTWLELRVSQGGRQFSQRFARGHAVSKLRDDGAANSTGTRITFAPDPEIFSSPLDPGPILARLHELTYFLPKLAIHFADRREHVFHEPRGLVAFVDAQSPHHAGEPTFTAAGLVGEVAVETVMRWSPTGWPSSIESFANVQPTTQGGTHTRGLILGLVAGLKQAAPRACARQPPSRLELAVSRGLIAVVCVRLNHPTYGAPTRDRLSTPAAKIAVKKCVAAAFTAFLEKERPVLDRILSALTITSSE